MAEAHNHGSLSTSVVDANDEELTAAPGESTPPGTFAKKPGGTLEECGQEDLARVEAALGRSWSAPNHPDGPGVGGD